MIDAPFSRYPFARYRIPFATALVLVHSVIHPIGLAPFAPFQPTALATPAPSIGFDPPAALPPVPMLNDPDGRKKGGASRGCNPEGAVAQESSFTVLVPTTQMSNQSIQWGLTTAERPTLWLHTPQGIKHGALVVMTLQDQGNGSTASNRSSHKINFQVPQTAPGVIQFTPPANTPALVAGKVYRWKLEIYCHSGTATTEADPTLDVPEIISGGIQRLALSPKLQRQLAITKNPLGQAKFYAKHGIWYDSLTTLGRQLQEKAVVDPAIARAWFDLLRQGNLETVATAPMVACCVPK